MISVKPDDEGGERDIPVRKGRASTILVNIFDSLEVSR